MRDICAVAIHGTGTVIVAGAGFGKSALAKEVRQQVANSNRTIKLVLCRDPSDIAVQQVLTGEDLPDILLVDDAHLLTDDAADQIWKIAAAGNLIVLATVRTGEYVPDGVTRLWTDGICERLDLKPLTNEQVHTLLVTVLEGDVEDRLSRTVYHRTEGNPLLIRELIRSARDSGAIEREHEVWCLSGPLPVDAGIANLIEMRLELLTPVEREATELLALGEPLAIKLTESIIDSEVLESLERQNVVQAQQVNDDMVLTLAHPLYAEVIQTSLAPLHRRRLQQRLLEAFEHDPQRHRNAVRIALWQLDLGHSTPADDLVDAARLARSVGASTAAQRLARAAVAKAATSEAIVLLAEILVQQGQVAEVDQLLDGIDLSTLDADATAEVLAVRALARIRLGELSQASELSSTTAPELDAPSLQALNAQSESLDGRTAAGASIARSIIADTAAPKPARCIAGLTLVSGGIFDGQYDEAVATAGQLRPLCDELHQELPFASGTLQVAGLIAATAAGYLDVASHDAAQIYESALRRDDEWLRPRGACALGVVALAQGNVNTATRYFRIMVASQTDFDVLFLRYNVAWLARAAAAAGLFEEAQTAMDDVGHDTPVYQLFAFDWSIAQAAIFAAQGQLNRAIAHNFEAAQQSAEAGLWGVAANAAFDALRYGGGAPAAALLIRIVEEVKGPLPALLGEAGEALVAPNPSALDSVSQSLEHLGYLLYAADIAHLGAQAHRKAGDMRASLAAVAKSRELGHRCVGAHRPWALDVGVVHGLTGREREVAILAATGSSDLQLAEQLGISIRTVQTHLAHAYMKLNISGRAELAEALLETE